MEKSLCCFVFHVKPILRAGGQEEFFPGVRSVKTVVVLVYLLASSFFCCPLKCGEGPACLNLPGNFSLYKAPTCAGT